MLGRYIDNSKISPLKLYAALELGIGLFAPALPYLLAGCNPFYRWIYQATSYNTCLIIVLKFILSFSLLPIPAFLMGGTLPVLSKYVGSSHHRFFLIHWLGVQGTLILMVALNILGGVNLIALNMRLKGALPVALASSLIVILTPGLATYSKNVFLNVLTDRLHYLNILDNNSEIIYYKEDTTSNTCATQHSSGSKNLIINPIPGCRQFP